MKIKRPRNVLVGLLVAVACIAAGPDSATDGGNAPRVNSVNRVGIENPMNA